jgi:Uma2 family endonuclease
MDQLVTDPNLQERLIAEGKAFGGDRFDEVWEGTYVRSPIADNVHQDLQLRLASTLLRVLENDRRIHVLAGTNVSDRADDWEHNYRCPDVAVFRAETSARDCGTHWLGGPDFAAEILSRGDRTQQKIPFYASLNVRELLVLDRSPWSIELHRLSDGELASVGRATPGGVEALESCLRPPSHVPFAAPPPGRAPDDRSRASRDRPAMVGLTPAW